MSTQEYLELILQEQSLSDDSKEMQALRKEREKVEAILKKAFEGSQLTIRYGGSKAKGTMIKDSFDLDILGYFAHDDTSAGETLREIFESVKKSLENDYQVVPKTSALRLEGKDPNKRGVYFHIDVVPGRFIDDKKEDVFLHQTSGDKERLKTNPGKHISYIRDSGLADIIKLVKFWNVRNGLQVKTFVLELLVVKILKDADPDKIGTCLRNSLKKRQHVCASRRTIKRVIAA